MSQSELMKSRRFSPLFWTQFFGAFNDNALKNALVILITFKASGVLGLPPEQMVALCGGIFILPFFLFSATAGQLADKYEKSTIIRWVKVIEISIMMLATAGFLFHHVEFLLAVLFLMGLHSTFFGPLKYSILPQLLKEEELIGGNALIESGTFLAILIGTILGGLLIAVEPQGPALVSGLLLLIALLGWGTSLLIPKAGASSPKLKVQWNPIPPTWEIYQFTRKNRPVYLSILGISWFWFFGAAFLSLFPPYCKDLLQTGEHGVTLFLTIFSIGIGIGSMFCERFSSGHLELGLVPFGSLGMSFFALDLFLIGSPGVSGLDQLLSTAAGWRILFDLLMLSVFSGFYIVPLYTLIQERSEASHRSRVIAGNNIMNALFMVVSSLLLVAMMNAHLTIPQIFLVLAVLNAVIATYIYTVIPEFFLRFLAWILAHFMYRLKVLDRHHVPKKGAAVLVCNHVSFVDWLIISAGIKRPVRFVMDHAYAQGFLSRHLLKQAKVIPITTAKENPALLQEAFEKIAQELRDGQLVCIFPEGRITADGKMNVFKPGIEKIIQATPVPVIPMALQGLWGSLFSRKKGARSLASFPWRLNSPVTLRIGSGVDSDSATAPLLSERVAGLRGEIS